MRLTVGNLINSRIPAALGLCPGQSASDRVRFLQWLNEAEDRLLAYGRWWGSIQEVQFCVRDCLLTWPWNVATVEQISSPCLGGPLDINNAWYSFTQTVANCSSCTPGLLGWGTSYCGPSSMTMLARKPCSFDVTAASGSILRFYIASSTDIGKTIIVQGRDSNGIWVRTTQPDGTVLDGEKVTLAMPWADTLTTWASGQPTALIKDVTNYRVLMYEHSLVTLQDRALGTYQPTEVNPEYRQSRIPLLQGLSTSSSACANPCGLTSIKALVKLAHVDVASDEDFVIFENRAAYKEAMLAVRDWENGDLVAGNFHFYGTPAPKQSRASNQATLSKAGAIPMLRAELRSMTSDRTDVEIHYENDARLQWELAGYR